MSGALSLLREVLYTYMAASGHEIPPGRALVAFGHISLAAFIVSGITFLMLERARHNATEAEYESVIAALRRDVDALSRLPKPHIGVYFDQADHNSFVRSDHPV